MWTRTDDNDECTLDLPALHRLATHDGHPIPSLLAAAAAIHLQYMHVDVHRRTDDNDECTLTLSLAHTFDIARHVVFDIRLRLRPHAT